MSIREKLTFISAAQRLDLSVSSKLDPEARLAVLSDQLLSRVKRPAVLWNLAPWNNFTMLHAVYCRQLKYYQDLGFVIVILIYDQWLTSFKNLSSHDEPEGLQAVSNIVRWCSNAGLTAENTEYILESDLWEMYGSTELLKLLNKLAYSTEVWKKSLPLMTVGVVIDNMLELVYETILGVDVVLTGGHDALQIWNSVRLQSLDTFIGKGSISPCVASFPVLYTAEGNVANTNSDSLSLRSIGSINNTLDECSVSFLRQVFDFFIIPYLGGSYILDGATMETFAEAQKNVDEKVLRHFIGVTLSEYFRRIDRE